MGAGVHLVSNGFNFPVRVEVLRDARALIAKPEAWCKRYYARDKDGRQANAGDLKAVCWCMAGAVDRAAHAFHANERQALQDVIGSDALATFNDRATHAEALAVFDEAIRRAEARETR